MSEAEILGRIQRLENAVQGKTAYEPSKFRRERAENDAVQRAAEDFKNSPSGQGIERLELRLDKLEAFIGQLHGEEGIDNEGPIFRLTRQFRNQGETKDFEEVELTFCDENDDEHTGIFYLKPGSIVPPL